MVVWGQCFNGHCHCGEVAIVCKEVHIKAKLMYGCSPRQKNWNFKKDWVEG